ncbi:hypothetical protein B0H11DRAFT_2041472 [Mycena galericulata]|nr:hypothetical protein B0H11DRAFT_2041472 [Mycena galericulata]
MTTVRYPPPPGPPPGFVTGVQYAPPPGPPPSMYAPPPGPPPPVLPQNATELSSFVRNSLAVLAFRGWLSLPLPPDLESIYATLFTDSAAFFNLPADSPDKLNYAAPSGKDASDEGFAEIPGEKQLITLRRSTRIPPPLRDTATAAWSATGALFLDAISAIAESLELPDQSAFDGLSSEARGALPDSGRAASLLRLFRYDRPPADTPTAKTIVAEAHKDLGLLTVVVGRSPGLDVRDPGTGEWVSVEDGGGEGRLTATLLAGQTLSYLTRGLYASGVHRVSVLPPPASAPHERHRFSLVFALRPAAAAPVHTDVFAQSPLIGPFPPAPLSPTSFPHCSMRGESGSTLFAAIAQTHWNVNVAPEVREKQKERIKTKKRGEGKEETKGGQEMDREEAKGEGGRGTGAAAP